MKKLKYGIAFILIFALSMFMFGCSSGEGKAKAAFDETMQAIKNCDRETIDKYYGFSELSAFADENTGEEFKGVLLSTLSSMEYSIKAAEKESGDKVKLNVEISTVDFSAVMQEYINNIAALTDDADYKAKVKDMTSEEYQKLVTQQMISAIENNKSSRTTKTMDITMVKSEDEWHLGGEYDELLGALFADMSKALAALI